MPQNLPLSEDELRALAAKQLLDEWLQHPQTKKLIGWLETEYEEQKESFARGDFNADTLSETALKTALASAHTAQIRATLLIMKEGINE